MEYDGNEYTPKDHYNPEIPCTCGQDQLQPYDCNCPMHGDKKNNMEKEHKNYISKPYHSIGGWKVCLMTWVKDETGEYYDVWNTSDGFKTPERAANYGRGWAMAEGIEYDPKPQEEPSPPSPEGEILLYEWEIPADYPRVTTHDDLPEAYRVYENKEASGGCIIEARYKGKWDANPWSVRPLVKHLLDQIKKQG